MHQDGLDNFISGQPLRVKCFLMSASATDIAALLPANTVDWWRSELPCRSMVRCLLDGLSESWSLVLVVVGLGVPSVFVEGDATVCPSDTNDRCCLRCRLFPPPLPLLMVFAQCRVDVAGRECANPAIDKERHLRTYEMDMRRPY